MTESADALPENLPAEEPSDEWAEGRTLLDQLDRRQNQILDQLDHLDRRIETLMQQLQRERSVRFPQPAAA